MRLLTTLLLLATAAAVHAQAAPSWIEDGLYAGAKMNAVIAVVILILLGMGVWLWLQDRRLTRMEQRLNNR